VETKFFSILKASGLAFITEREAVWRSLVERNHLCGKICKLYVLMHVFWIYLYKFKCIEIQFHNIIHHLLIFRTLIVLIINILLNTIFCSHEYLQNIMTEANYLSTFSPFPNITSAESFWRNTKMCAQETKKYFAQHCWRSMSEVERLMFTKWSNEKVLFLAYQQNIEVRRINIFWAFEKIRSAR